MGEKENRDNNVREGHVQNVNEQKENIVQRLKEGNDEKRTACACRGRKKIRKDNKKRWKNEI